MLIFPLRSKKESEVSPFCSWHPVLINKAKCIVKKTRSDPQLAVLFLWVEMESDPVTDWWPCEDQLSLFWAPFGSVLADTS